jgi:hypothetical protein
MSKEIRLPAPHPLFIPRQKGLGRRVDHPGTAVRCDGEVFEIMTMEKTGGQWVYHLEPWDGLHTPRTCVSWELQSEHVFSAQVRRERVQGGKQQLAWRLRVLLGFLPAGHQRRLEATLGLDPARATFASALAELMVSLVILVLAAISRFGGGISGEQGVYSPWLNPPAWLTVLAACMALESLVRLVLVTADGDPRGSFLLALLDLRFKSAEGGDLNKDDYAHAGNLLVARTPAQKMHWERWGGVNFQGQDYALLDCRRIHTSWLYRLEISQTPFSAVTEDSERAYNVASDRSFVLAPLWGFLPAELQNEAASFGRYHPPAFVLWSIIVNLFFSLPALVVDVFAVSSGHAVLWNYFRGALAAFLLHESLFRLVRYWKGREITGSFLGLLIKPVYYMAVRDGVRL